MGKSTVQIDPSFFADIADALGLPSPALPEKDYYAVQLLKLITLKQFDSHELIFAGISFIKISFEYF